MKNANLLSRAAWLKIVFVGVLVALLPTGCDREPTTKTPPKTIADRFDIKVGNKVVHMQLAVHETEMTRGLMERRDLGRDEGMLFIYERPQRMSFWMRNTPTPLDIGFFNAGGQLEEVYPLHPFDETTVASRGTHLLFALETNQGWFHENEIKPGTQLDTSAVVAALKARGFEPAKFGLER